MNVEINYKPHPCQQLIHEDCHRFRIIAAGRRFGKTVLAINELIRAAIQNPDRRSWYISPTFKQAKDNAWNDPKSGIFSFLPKKFIAKVSQTELSIKLTNGHLIQFKGAENKEKLRGVGLVFVVLDEFGQMSDDVWNTIVRPMLADTKGGALFIGTPTLNGTTNFYDLFKIGQTNDPNYKSWRFFTSDNIAEPNLKSEMEEAEKSLPSEEFNREWKADFSTDEGLVFNNFNYDYNVISSYEPHQEDIIVGSIDPGLVNETAALLVAWDKTGKGRAFREYYQKGFLAEDNAINIQAIAKPFKVSYWVIDRAALKRDPRTGLTVFSIYQQYLRPLMASPNDPGSVLLGINECKRLFQIDPKTKECKFLVSSELRNFINEIQHYIWYKPKWETRTNLPEKPRKYKDHLIDCWKNMILSRPWLRHSLDFKDLVKYKRPDYTGY